MTVTDLLALVAAFHAAIGYLMRVMSEPDPHEWERRGNPRSYR